MTEGADVYEQMGDFYDLVYSEQFDSDFYLKEAKKAEGPVLELGCGTGRIAIKLAKEGIDVTGLDMSEKMLELLKRNAHQAGVKVKTYLGDMRDFNIEEKFRLAVFPYRSFLHLLSTADREKTLANVYNHLEEGGKVILHVYNPSQEELETTGEPHKIDETEAIKEGKKYLMKWFLQYHPENGTADYMIVVHREDGTEKEKFKMTVSFITVAELKTILEEAGYRNIKSYCGFDYEEYDGMCQEIVVVAEK